jgi:hypothetical protein
LVLGQHLATGFLFHIWQQWRKDWRSRMYVKVWRFSKANQRYFLNKSRHLLCGGAELENREKCKRNSSSLYENIGLFYKAI